MANGFQTHRAKHTPAATWVGDSLARSFGGPKAGSPGGLKRSANYSARERKFKAITEGLKVANPGDLEEGVTYDNDYAGERAAYAESVASIRAGGGILGLIAGWRAGETERANVEHHNRIEREKIEAARVKAQQERADEFAKLRLQNPKGWWESYQRPILENELASVSPDSGAAAELQQEIQDGDLRFWGRDRVAGVGREDWKNPGEMFTYASELLRDGDTANDERAQFLMEQALEWKRTGVSPVNLNLGDRNSIFKENDENYKAGEAAIKAAGEEVVKARNYERVAEDSLNWIEANLPEGQDTDKWTVFWSGLARELGFEGDASNAAVYAKSVMAAFGNKPEGETRLTDQDYDNLLRTVISEKNSRGFGALLTGLATERNLEAQQYARYVSAEMERATNLARAGQAKGSRFSLHTPGQTYDDWKEKEREAGREVFDYNARRAAARGGAMDTTVDREMAIKRAVGNFDKSFWLNDWRKKNPDGPNPDNRELALHYYVYSVDGAKRKQRAKLVSQLEDEWDTGYDSIRGMGILGGNLQKKLGLTRQYVEDPDQFMDTYYNAVWAK